MSGSARTPTPLGTEPSLPSALARSFLERFAQPARLFSAPGRVNLIGEHTDYNDGFVLPMAIDRRTYVGAAPRADRRLTAFSLDTGNGFECDLERPGARRRGLWGDYVEGTAQALIARGFAVPGADLMLKSEVPAGAGLSASAALELSVGRALAVLGGTPEPDPLALALAGQSAEHDYVGTACGIMDQFVAAFGRPGHALLVDCRSLEATPVPFVLGDARLLICDTRVKHALASSEYNRRVEECGRAVAALAGVLPDVRALRDVSLADFERHQGLLDEVARRRARHVIGENARTLAAVAALRAGDLAGFGALMTDSHRSLRDDFEVSSPELDLTVATALGVPGVYGARMTGGGFGGCAIALVRADAVDEVYRVVEETFQQAFGSRPELFTSEASEGARDEPEFG